MLGETRSHRQQADAAARQRAEPDTPQTAHCCLTACSRSAGRLLLPGQPGRAGHWAPQALLPCCAKLLLQPTALRAVVMFVAPGQTSITGWTVAADVMLCHCVDWATGYKYWVHCLRYDKGSPVGRNVQKRFAALQHIASSPDKGCGGSLLRESRGLGLKGTVLNYSVKFRA